MGRTATDTARSINILGDFCGMRDIAALTSEALQRYCGLAQADVMVLFGGSILAGGDVLAAAMRNGIARKYIIVGGAGHTTETLRQKIRAECPEIDTADMPEAEAFNGYLQAKYGIVADALETRSTNCGNNITYLLELMKAQGIACESIILCQDATMQRRMEAGLRRYAPEMKIVNYAAYRAEAAAAENGICFAQDIHGMWNMERYLNLLMGEIPRLRDDENGYGPNGAGFIAHVDIPQNVLDAYEVLKQTFGENRREANPLFASK